MNKKDVFSTDHMLHVIIKALSVHFYLHTCDSFTLQRLFQTSEKHLQVTKPQFRIIITRIFTIHCVIM